MSMINVPADLEDDNWIVRIKCKPSSDTINMSADSKDDNLITIIETYTIH